MDLYLSRLILQPRNRDVQRDLSDVQNLHRTVMSGFPPAVPGGGPARDTFGVLFRPEASARGERLQLIVQSRVEPDWRGLRPGYLLPGPGVENPGVKPIGPALEAIRERARYAFRLRANPTKRVAALAGGEDGRWAGKRVDLYREEDRLRWLERKAEAAGFRLVVVRVDGGEDKEHGYRRGAEGAEAPRVTFGAARFEGVLEVLDATRLREALVEGIGPGKAYGFGLLSLAPVRALP